MGLISPKNGGGGTQGLAKGENGEFLFTDANGTFGVDPFANGYGRFTDETGSGTGWYLWEGTAFRSANTTNATTTMASTGLSVDLDNVAGISYGFKLVLYVANSVAADGIKIDFDGGNAGATAFRAHVQILDTALLTSAQVSALATDVSAATITGDTVVIAEGYIDPSGAGTFIPQYAMAAATTGVLTLYAGSHLLVWPMR